MIRVTIELLPAGDESRKRTLGTMEISNDGTGDQEIGRYLTRDLQIAYGSLDITIQRWALCCDG